MQDQYLQLLDQSLEVVEGFPCPQWEKIQAWARLNIPDGDQERFIAAIKDEWLDRFCQSLGESYQIYESRRVILISADAEETCLDVARFAERSLSEIRQILGDLAAEDDRGKHVIILMNDIETYTRYLVYFQHAKNSMSAIDAFPGHGYEPIVLAPQEVRPLQINLFHELTVNSLMHLSLPVWLHGGLLHHVQITGGYVSHLNLCPEGAQKHWDFWDVNNIQDFWSGKAFYRPHEGASLSHELAKILIQLIFSDIRPDMEDFYDFAWEAAIEDAGEASAREYLQVGLGEIAAIFLGEGAWTPVPRESGETKPD